jgi:hypothetical protein
MSYALTAYLLDLADLKSAIGSKDKSIIRDVEPGIENTYRRDKKQADVRRAAVRALVMGVKLDPKNAVQYGAALCDICRVKGEELLPDAWGGVRFESVEACGLEDLLTKTGPPVGLPPYTDFPCIGYIKRDKIAEYIKAAEEQKEEASPNVIGLLDEYLEWLETARSKCKDIVFFYG